MVAHRPASGIGPAKSVRRLNAGSGQILVPLDQGVGGVIVDGLEVLALDRVGADPGLGIEADCDVTHQILDEFRVVVGALGDELLVRALEQPV